MTTVIGANYKSSQSNWTADSAYYLQHKMPARPHLTVLPNPWAVGTPGTSGTANLNAYWRLCAETLAAAGLYVTWGPSGITGMGSYRGGGLTATLWTAYHTAIIAEASYLQSQGIALGDFTLGNELEAFADGTTLTVAQVRANIRQLALDVKTVYSLSPISYSANNFNNTNWASWASEGLGGLDLLSLHAYGVVDTSESYCYWTPGDFGGPLQTMVAALGSRCYISEFNLDSSSTNIQLLTPEQAITAMRQVWATIKTTGVSKALVYEWCQYLNATPSDQGYVMQNNDGSFNPVWDVLLNDGHRTTTVPG